MKKYEKNALYPCPKCGNKGNHRPKYINITDMLEVYCMTCFNLIIKTLPLDSTVDES